MSHLHDEDDLAWNGGGRQTTRSALRVAVRYDSLVSSSSERSRVRVVTAGMSYGPHAIARSDGMVLFVRGAAPGEEVDVVVRERHRAYAFADVVQVVRASEKRVVAVCPYLPRCGGCAWQHLDYEAQLEAKRAIVRDQLRRIAGLDVPVAPVLASPRVFGYRRRIKLRVEERRLGFYAGASHDLVRVDHCLLAESGVDDAIDPVSRLVRSLASKVRRIEILAQRAGVAQIVVAGEVEGPWQSGDDRVCETWLAAGSRRRGVTMRGRGWSREWGDTSVDTQIDGDSYLSLQAPGFTQVNAAANRLLIDTVVRNVDPRPSQRVLDLYAGAGNFSAPLAQRGARVVAVEQSQTATAAQCNAQRLGAGWQVRRERVERALVALVSEGAYFDAVVLDPPRSGAADPVTKLLRMAPRRIVYVSCDPATLARDLKVLAQRYRITDVQPIDMFPHTYHVETVVSCELARAEIPGSR
jgi:23S rRNA (uracil1939-C5)-methyltransferase